MESIESLNQRLIDYYGITVDSGESIWRIVWSDDQVEKRLTRHTREGFELLVPEVQELPKYRQWIHNRWVLEQLVRVPEGTSKELTVNQISYEPMWVFQNDKDEALYPVWEALELIISTVQAARGHSGAFAKYRDPEGSKEGAIQAKQERIAKIEESLFGNESNVTDALAHNQAVTVPSTYGDFDVTYTPGSEPKDN